MRSKLICPSHLQLVGCVSFCPKTLASANGYKAMSMLLTTLSSLRRAFHLVASAIVGLASEFTTVSYYMIQNMTRCLGRRSNHMYNFGVILSAGRFFGAHPFQ